MASQLLILMIFTFSATVVLPTTWALDTEDDPRSTSQINNEFIWDHHPSDHGVYAGRSLISTQDIKNNTEAPSDGADRRIDFEANKITDEEFDPLKTSDFVEKEWQLMFRSLDMAHDSMANSMIEQIGKQTNLFEEVFSRLEPKCRREIYHIRDSVKKHKLWALRMLDSNGKIPSGVTYGRFSSPGDYEECLGVRVDESIWHDNAKEEYHKFHGKYCLIDFRLPMPERPRNKLLSIHEPVLNLTNTELMQQFPEMANYSAYASIFYEVGYTHAICIPNICDVKDLTRSIGKAFAGLHVIVNNTVDCEELPQERPPLRISQKISLFLFAILFLNAGIASFARFMLPDRVKDQADHHGVGDASKLSKDDHGAQSKSSGLRQKIIEFSIKNKTYSDCFSVQKNFERLTKPDPRGLTFVHYTRIVAMALTVITHTAAMGTLQAITKPADASNSEQIFRDFIPQMLANAFTSIQIFFFMAGFMLVISTYPSIKRDKGHLSFVEYSTKRAIRLMPGIAATICLNFVWPLFVDGPMLNYFIRMIMIPCESNWWHTMGFISNFDHVEKMCLRHSYFSASDYQLHVMAFPLLLLLYKQPTISLAIAGILTVGGFVAQVIMILTKTVLPFMMVDYIDKEAFFNVVHYIHHPVWNHVSAFFYGFIIGYLVVKQIRINLRPVTIKRLWFIMLPAGIASIFAPYFWNHYKRPIHKWQMILYVLFDRFILLSTCAWLSYATMVLARKPPTSKSKPQSLPPKDQKNIGLNLPGIVALKPDQEKDKQETSVNQTTNQQDQALSNDENINSLRVASSGMPRQRSSPDFYQLHSHQQDSSLRRPVSRTTSTMNLAQISSISEEKQQDEPQNDKNTTNQTQTDENAIKNKEQATVTSQQSRNARQAPISNVNTLCLVLSRLTFQLYLFNMVVLWIDVNHSKYYWYFSYYFIILKAAAIYICSSLMAMIFFVLLESPSLTIYIAWVKSRASKRAKHALTEKPDETTNNQKIHLGSSGGPFVGNKTEPRISLNPDNRKQSPGSTKSGKSNDGLCMRMGTPDPVKPTISFIDLSTNPSLPGEEQASSDQTRM